MSLSVEPSRDDQGRPVCANCFTLRAHSTPLGRPCRERPGPGRWPLGRGDRPAERFFDDDDRAAPRPQAPRRLALGMTQFPPCFGVVRLGSAGRA